MPTPSSLPALVVILAIAACHGATVSYSLDVRPWVVDYQRPTADPRIAPFTVARGSKLQALLANNSYPGPTITASPGDTIHVTVNNNLLMNEITLTFEGLKVQKAPKQRIEAQGDSFTYELLATTPGTYWWHADSDIQSASGLRGPIIVRNSSVTVEQPVVVLSDARPFPRVCFNDSDKWDLGNCPGIDKATINGVWGDGSKGWPYAQIEVSAGQCYDMQFLGFAVQPGNMFEIGVQSHTFSLPDGTKGIQTLGVAPDQLKAVPATLCADQKSGEYTISYSYYQLDHPDQKKTFGAKLKYV